MLAKNSIQDIYDRAVDAYVNSSGLDAVSEIRDDEGPDGQEEESSVSILRESQC